MKHRVPTRTLLVALTLCASRALAQPAAIAQPASLAQPVWVVAETPDAEATAPLLERTERALRDAGLTVVANERAREAFEATLSRPPQELSQRQIDEWAARSTSAVRNLARADYDAARVDLEQTQRLAVSAVEELNREATRARQVLDNCLFFVRAFVETEDFDRAETQTRECRMLVPRIEPSTFRHTPEVRDVLARVDGEIARGPRGSLRVESAPPGCAVRLNGMPSGSTPFVLDDVAPGSYRVQVECGADERGRVHPVEVRGGETTSVTIDAAFDQAFLSRPYVHLRAGGRNLDHARRLARIMNVTVVVLEPARPFDGAVSDDASDWRARVVRPGEASEPLTLGPALVASLRGAPAPVETLRDEGPRPQRRRAWQLGVGFGAAALGVGAYVGGALMHSARGVRGDQYLAAAVTDPDFGDRQTRWRELGAPTHLLAFGGGVLLSTGLAFVLPERDGVPWWAWVSGGLGLVTAGVAVALVPGMSECENVAVDREACVERGQAGQRVSFLASAALPLLTVPLTYLFGRGRVDVAASASPEHAVLTLRGAF
ncbi:MAG: PEGA domain-containing protein [Myxococcales bacterium]|nr:PEGA domain-containing protein [Myxococcales bacterium]